jgi:hypothetical protein
VTLKDYAGGVRGMLTALVALFGCSMPTAGLINADGGPGSDAGLPDSGVPSDSGIPTDAGTPNDAGGMDAGSGDDAGVDGGTDAGSDAGTDGGVDSGMDGRLACMPFPTLGEAVLLSDGGESPGSLTWVLERADFNQDGVDDLVQLRYDGTAQIYYGLSDGGLEAGPTIIGYAPALAVGDLNSDGWPDLVTIDQAVAGGALNIAMNQQDGSFSGYELPYGGSPWAFAIADLDGDGTPDLAVCDYSTGTNVFFNDGTVMPNAGGAPGFLPAVSVSGTSCYSLVAVPQLGFGSLPSLAWVDATEDGGLHVWSNPGSGTFALPVIYPLTGFGLSIRTADFNGDGLMDLAVGTSSSIYTSPPPQGGLSLYLSVDGGVFGPEIVVAAPPGTLVQRISIADVNGDGYPDVLSGGGDNCPNGDPNDAGGAVVLFLNDCDGGFSSGVTLDDGLGAAFAVTPLRAAGMPLPGIVVGDLCAGDLIMIPNLTP